MEARELRIVFCITGEAYVPSSVNRRVLKLKTIINKILF
jgi:hypothetical protein